MVNGMNTSSAVRRASSVTVARWSLDAVMSRKHNSSAPSASYRTASSTGSPASRMSTKLVPLTTRPLSTSRQGMTRRSSISGLPLASFPGRARSTRQPPLVQQGLGLADLKPPFVESLARDHADEVGRPQPRQRAQVIQGTDPSRIDDVAREGGAHAAHLAEVGALQHPVALDRGVDHAAHAALAELGQHLLGFAR